MSRTCKDCRYNPDNINCALVVRCNTTIYRDVITDERTARLYYPACIDYKEVSND